MNKTVVLEVKDIDEKGFGVAVHNNRRIKIAYTLPGEKVKIRLPRFTKKPVKPLKIIEESPDRVRSLCPYFSICGGCQWQHIKYEKQLELKQRMMERVFQSVLDECSLNKIIKADSIWRYRNKMEFSFAPGAQGLVLGLKMLGRYDKVVNLDLCLLQKEEGDTTLRQVKELAQEEKLEPYDNRKHTGFLRFLVIRSSFNKNQMMTILVTTSKKRPPLEKLEEKITTTSLIWSVTDSLADVAEGEIKEVRGQSYIEEILLGRIFRISPYSFFQTNPLQAEKLFEILKKVSPAGNLALDLYCGVGVIAILVAEQFEIVKGIEINAEAVATAYENAKLNDIKNVEFITGKVEDTLLTIKEKVNAVYIDPPRAGMHKRAIEALKKLKPEVIIYISCNPRTQAQDVMALKKIGYHIKLIQPIDFFPHTPHIENLVFLEKEK